MSQQENDKKKHRETETKKNIEKLKQNRFNLLKFEKQISQLLRHTGVFVCNLWVF